MELDSPLDADYVAEEITNVVRFSLNETFPSSVVAIKNKSVSLKLNKNLQYSNLASQKLLVNNTSKSVYFTLMNNLGAVLNDDNVLAIEKINVEICTDDKFKIDLNNSLAYSPAT